MPVHENMHWYLAIVVNPGAILQERPRDAKLLSGFAARKSVRQSGPSAPNSPSQMPSAGTVISPSKIPSASSAMSRSSAPASPSKKPTPIVPGESRKPSPPLADAPVEAPQAIEKAYVLVFDSLGASHGPVKTALRDYLRLEAQDKKLIPDGVDLRRLGDPTHIDVRVPAQPNYCDCGIYLLHYVQRFFSDPDHFFQIALASEKGSPKAAIVHDDWHQGPMDAKRAEWRHLVATLSEAWRATQAGSLPSESPSRSGAMDYGTAFL